MRNRRYGLLLVFMLLAGVVGMVNAQKKPEMKSIYMFGFAASFSDSVSCQTQVQRMDSAWLDNHGFLIDRSLYSLQLQSYVEQMEGVKNPVCTIFFNKKERRIRKLWQKLKKRYDAEQNLIHRDVPVEKFSFKPEEYRPVIIGDESVAGSDSTAVAANPQLLPPPTKKKKKK